MRTRIIRTFAPQVERLEVRDCPNATVTYQDGLLSIVGDRADDDIAVVNTWAGTQVSTAHDGNKYLSTFVGVRAVSIQAKGGDDRVSFSSMVGERPAPMPSL